jgi:hypothetical protein
VYRAKVEVAAPVEAEVKQDTKSVAKSGMGGARAADPALQADNARLQNKYAKASAISSDSFFGRDEDRTEVQAKLNKFSSSSAISSDAYFGRQPEHVEEDEDGTIDLGDAVNMVADQAEQVWHPVADAAATTPTPLDAPDATATHVHSLCVFVVCRRHVCTVVVSRAGWVVVLTVTPCACPCFSWCLL